MRAWNLVGPNFGHCSVNEFINFNFNIYIYDMIYDMMYKIFIQIYQLDSAKYESRNRSKFWQKCKHFDLALSIILSMLWLWNNVNK